MTALKGRRAQVLVSGAPAAFSQAPTTASQGRTVYQASAATRRVWTPRGEVTVERSADGTTWEQVAGAEYRLDRLFGRVIFRSPQPAGTQIRISGEYLPLSVAAAARSYSYTLQANLEERSSFDDSDDYIRRRQTMLDVSGTIGRWYELDPYFSDSLASGEPVVIEIWSDRASVGPDLRARVQLASGQISGEATGLLEEEVEWEGAADIDGRAVSLP